MKHLVKLDFDLYYAFSEEIRVLSDEDLIKLKGLIGKEFYLGEIAGKHSEIYGKFEENDYMVLASYEDDDIFVVEFERLFPLGFGINATYAIFNEGD